MLLNEAINILKYFKEDVVSNPFTYPHVDASVIRAINTISEKVETRVMSYNELIKECEDIASNKVSEEALTDIIKMIKNLAQQNVIIIN